MPFLKMYLSKISAFAKKIIIIGAVYFLVLALFGYFMNKDKSPLTQRVDPIEKNRVEIYKVINDKELNKTKEGKLTISIYRGVMCSMIGEACSDNPKDGDKNFGKSAFGFMSNLVNYPFANPPASGIAWVSNGLQSAGFIPKSYAAEGIGFAALRPLSNLWKIFRDLSYMLLVLVLIAIGFMIMFRMKINPQTVISVENALPKIVVSLILITFSFAIAGFMIDLMYVLIMLVISILSKNSMIHIDVQQYQNDVLGGAWLGGKNVFWKFGDLVFGIGNQHSIGNALLTMLPSAIRVIASTIVTFVTFFLLKALPGIGPFLTGQFAKGVAESGEVVYTIWSVLSAGPMWIISVLLSGLLVPLIISLLVYFTLIFLFFRISLMLFKAFIKLIILIIFAPVLLLLEAIPGKNIFSWWIKNLLGNIIPFPLVVLFMIIAKIIAESTTTTSYWTPPLLPGTSPEFSVLIGVGILFMIPDFVKTIKEAFGIKPMPVNIGLGTYLGGAGAAVGGATGLVGQVGSLSLGLNALTGKSDFIGTLIGRKPPAIGGAVTKANDVDLEKSTEKVQTK